MSGGSQHNPNGRQSQLGSGWSPLQLQVANLLARAPQAHMASERGVTWHTPTPPPHLYHVPAPSPPDPLQGLLQLQAMKASGNSVFRHTATPPELYRHTPTPPDKHLLRHTPSPGDVKAGTGIPPAELYPHLGPSRDKLVRAEELLAYARGGVDLTVGSRGANGSPAPHTAPSLSVRDAPTINSLIARAAPHARPSHTRVDALLERLSAPAPASPHSVIVHSRAAPTPSPPSSNEDSADSCGAPPGSKRKRKPERTIRVPLPPPPSEQPHPLIATATHTPTTPVENGDTHIHNGPEKPDKSEKNDKPEQPEQPEQSEQPDQPEKSDKLDKPVDEKPEKPPSPQPEPEPHARRKSRHDSAETIDDIAAMIASTERRDISEPPPLPIEPETPVTIDKLKSVLASPEPEKSPPPEKPLEAKKSPPKSPPKEAIKSPPKKDDLEPPPTAAAPRRRSVRTNSESTNVPVESPSEAKPAEPEASETKTAEPTSASFVEVENQLEKMFAGIEENPAESKVEEKTIKARKRRKSAPTKGEKKASKRSSRRSTGDEPARRKVARKKPGNKKESMKDAYDSGSNASSSRSRGPYIQIVGPRDSPVSVSVVNATDTEQRSGEEWRGVRARGLHASTLGLRYDAATPDASWRCAFCERGPHSAGLGDLFGPYTAPTTCAEYRSLDEASQNRFPVVEGGVEVWFHEACAVWAPGLVAAGARVWGLAPAVWGARASKCSHCAAGGAPLACAVRSCRARAHLPCAAAERWRLDHDAFRAACPRHA